MRKILNILVALALGIGVVACNSPRIIPDKVLAEIFHDAILVNAYLQQHNGKMQDSINIYEPIFHKYGYTTEDVHHTINNFSRRKSASLGMVTNYAADLFKHQSEKLQLLADKQDTIDNVARRRSERVIYHDTAIIAKSKADTALLRIRVHNVHPGKYTVTGNYTLDKEDKGKGRRCYISLMRGDSVVRVLTSTALVSGRKGHINLHFELRESDLNADNVLIDFHRFNLKKNRLKKTLITIHEISVRHKISEQEALQLLFNEQSYMRIFADTMLNFKVAPIDSLTVDSLTVDSLRADSLAVDSLAVEALDSLLTEKIDSLSVEQGDSLTTQKQ